NGRWTRPEVELRWIGERRGSTPPGEEAKAVDDGAGQTAFDIVGADRDGALGQARCVDRGPTRTVDGVVGQDHVSGPGPTDVQSLRVSVDGVVHDRHVAYMRNLRVRRGRDAGEHGIEDEIVPDNGIGDDLNRFTAVPHGIAFDDVEAAPATVDENARILPPGERVVDDVVANDVPMGPGLHLDAVIAAITRRSS